jgi:hypothetical protein
MNLQRLKISLETAGIRARTRLRLLVQLAGIGLVVIGGLNLLIAPISTIDPVAQQIVYQPVQNSVGLRPMHADVVLIAVGAIIAWLF